MCEFNQKQITVDDNLGKGQVLIIDDDHMVRACMKKMVGNCLQRLKLNYEILEGTDGTDLVRYVVNDTNDLIRLIFTDENMNEVEGSEAIRAIRDIKENKSIKVVSITSVEDDVSIKLIKDAGADRVYKKPVTRELLEQVVELYLT
jgi:CheY-like chemotaxis protein